MGDISSAVRMVHEKQDVVMNMEPVQWWRPSHRTRQDRVDRTDTIGERLDVLKAWRGEVVPCAWGWLIHDGFSVWASKLLSPKTWRNEDITLDGLTGGPG
jgi:hypothetical protein